MLDELFAQRTLDEWAPALDRHSLIWAPAKTLGEVLADPQTRARAAFTTIDHPDAGPIEIVDTPVKFGRSTVGARGAAPELGQHTEQVLLDAGYGWDEIAALRDAGVI